MGEAEITGANAEGENKVLLTNNSFGTLVACSNNQDRRIESVLMFSRQMSTFMSSERNMSSLF